MYSRFFEGLYCFLCGRGGYEFLVLFLFFYRSEWSYVGVVVVVVAAAAGFSVSLLELLVGRKVGG